MAKKIARKRGAVAEANAVAAKLTPKDKKTMGSIVGLADGVVERGREAPRSVRRYPVAHAVERPLQPAEADPRDGQRHQPAAALRSVAGQGLHADDAGRQRLQEADRRKARRPACEVCTTCSSTRSKAPRKNTFDDQDECDTIIEDVEVLLDQPARRAAPVRREARRDGRATSRSSTAATRSTARGWAPAATAFRRSSSRT